MQTTAKRLDDFHAFATRQLANGGADITLEQLFQDWQEFQAACEDIRAGLDERTAGTGKLVGDFAEQMSRRHGIGVEP